MPDGQCPLYPSNAHEPMFSCSQVQDMVNKIDDGSGVLDFEDFLLVRILYQCVLLGKTLLTILHVQTDNNMSTTFQKKYAPKTYIPHV